MAVKPHRQARDLPSTAVFPFILITFAITWGTIGLFIFLPERAAAWLGEISGSHPAFILATWAPAIAGFVLVLVYGGADGVRRFLARLTLWRCPPAWVAFLLIGIPLVFGAGAWVKGSLFAAPFPFDSAGALLGALAFMAILGPVEEFGWRGVAQPILQRHIAPLWAGLVIGAVWGFWHLPVFYLAGTLQSGWSFTPFFIGNLALAVIVTPLFNASRGSILLPMLLHWQLINPLWPDAQPHDTWLFVLVAIVITWLNRASMFAKSAATVAVMPDSPASLRR